MTSPAGSAHWSAPRRLVVVGAAAGMGRWLLDHLLLARTWDGIVLVDAAEDALAEARSLLRLEHGLPDTTTLHVASPDRQTPNRLVVSADARADTNPDELLLHKPGTTVLLAVPSDALGSVLEWLVPLLADDATIGVVSANQTAGIDLVAAEWRRDLVFGLHPLFDASARSAEGQTFLVVGDDGVPAAAWLTDLIASVGAISDSGTAADHDAIMRYVQTMAHQTLIGFADAVTASGLDLQHVWEARTPVFEALFGLAARVLAERQQATVADIQASMGGTAAADELARAANRFGAALSADDPAAVEALLIGVRDRFGGTLFETIQATAASAVSAAQSKRAELARHRRTGALVGVRPVGRRRALRVGTIAEVTPVSVSLRETMVGDRGRAALIDGPGRHNAARLGLNGTPTETRFGLGHIDVLVGDELESALDEWLAFIRRDVQFLVPESVAGAGVLTIVSAHPGVRDASVRDEVVRTGQRAVTIGVHVRADHDVDDMIEELRTHVQSTYRWPGGVTSATAATHVHYLGPAGTFSEVAAAQARSQAGDAGILLEPHPDFGAVLAAIGDDQLGVLPISSSASGLVSRAVRALLDHPGELVCGGVVDVAVRIDAFVAADRSLADLRGARVLSHPQALGQCERFIRRNDLTAVPCSSTAEALLLVRDDPAGAVALAGAGFDLPDGIKVAERDVDDLSGSITRFLILGGPATFGALSGGWAPTLRSLWVAESVASIVSLIGRGEAAFDELLTDADGRCLWVTSRETGGVLPEGARSLGRAPWSPRTPVVRVEVDVPADRA